MSMFTGKCDFCDTIEIFGVDNILKKYRVFVSDHEIIPLAFKEPRDFIPYYPYMVVAMYKSDNGGKIVLSSKSYIDTSEEETLTSDLDDIKKYWRKCKRSKKPFDKDEATKMVSLFGWERPYIRELVDRVDQCGEKATIENIHIPYEDNQRDRLYNLMVDNGFNKNDAYIHVYGFKRWVDFIKEEKANAI